MIVTTTTVFGWCWMDRGSWHSATVQLTPPTLNTKAPRALSPWAHLYQVGAVLLLVAAAKSQADTAAGNPAPRPPCACRSTSPARSSSAVCASRRRHHSLGRSPHPASLGQPIPTPRSPLLLASVQYPIPGTTLFALDQPQAQPLEVGWRAPHSDALTVTIPNQRRGGTPVHPPHDRVAIPYSSGNPFPLYAAPQQLAFISEG